MIPSSLRWRLPLSYAAVALIATLVLGAVLLLTLQRYYRQQELDYLRRNGRTIGEQIVPQMEQPGLADALQAQVKGLAFLTQRRIQIFDPTRATLLADSGDPLQPDATTRLSLEVAVEGAGRQFAQSFSFQTSETESEPKVIVQNQFVNQNVGQTAVVTQTTSVEGGAADPEIVSPLQVAGTLFGFGLNTALDGTEARSSLAAIEPVFGQTGELVGYVVVSEGPDYGRDIVRSVAWGLLAAGSVAVVLAALAGWFASQRLTRPLLLLTETTQQMAAGDLSARTSPRTLRREDELGLLAAAFNTMATRVEETVTTLRRFVADAAHELNTPLTALRTDLELAAEGQTKGHDGHDGGDALQRAQRQIERLEQLTTGLLNLSHLEAPAAASELVEIDLGALVMALAEPYASRGEQKGVDFQVARPTGPVVVRGEVNQLQQALGNLFDNALKFTAAGGRVEVGVGMDAGWAAVTVTDTGIGIPADDQAYLFERFHRGRNAAAYPGNGLGLAIARAIIGRHHGQIDVSSGESGSCFTVRLPLAE